MTSLTTANGSTTYYIYDADGERLGTVVRPAATSQNTIRWTVRGLGHELLRTFTDTNGSWSWTDDNIFRDGKLLANLSSTGTKHFALDHLGSPRVVTGPLSTNVAYENFAPFGEGGATGAGSLQFTGHERDWSPAGGSDPLDYMHARWYSAVTGRFLSLDPSLDQEKTVSAPQMWNRYVYVVNNSMSSIDPDGRAAVGFTGFSGPNPGSYIDKITVALLGTPHLGHVRTFNSNEYQEAAAWLIREHAAHPDDATVIYGHSWGGDAALRTAAILKDANVPVKLVITLDAVGKWGDFSLGAANRLSVPPTVERALNFFQTANHPGNNELGAANPKTTQVRNIFTPNVTHQTIDDRLWQSIVTLIQRTIN
jgi:RHS repeat-associated protein